MILCNVGDGLIFGTYKKVYFKQFGSSGIQKHEFLILKTALNAFLNHLMGDVSIFQLILSCCSTTTCRRNCTFSSQKTLTSDSCVLQKRNYSVLARVFVCVRISMCVCFCVCFCMITQKEIDLGT